MQDQEHLKTQSLPVPLTDAELAIRSQEMASAEALVADAEQRLEQFVEAAKTTKQEITTEVAEHRAEVRRLSGIVRGRRENRQVPIIEEMDFPNGAVHTLRVDTNEVIATRGMSDAERQQSLFRDQKPKPQKGAGA